MKILNLGWGIQSFTLAAMVALGELEPIDAAIHADTTHEREATYTFAAKWTPWLQAHGVRVITLTGDRINAIDEKRGSFIPAFTDTPSRSGGMLRRECTSEWKISPIRRWVRENLPRMANVEQNVYYDGEVSIKKISPVEQWLGISLDEAERMRKSDVKYIAHRWPLIEKRMSRNDCIAWLARHDLEVPVKSSCVFCPYHSRSAWYAMKRENGSDWKKAVEVDESIRNVRPPFDLFLHSDRIPLIDIRSPQENGQLDMFSEECSGTCFV